MAIGAGGGDRDHEGESVVALDRGVVAQANTTVANQPSRGSSSVEDPPSRPSSSSGSGAGVSTCAPRIQAAAPAAPAAASARRCQNRRSGSAAAAARPCARRGRHASSRSPRGFALVGLRPALGRGPGEAGPEQRLGGAVRGGAAQGPIGHDARLVADLGQGALQAESQVRDRAAVGGLRAQRAIDRVSQARRRQVPPLAARGAARRIAGRATSGVRDVTVGAQRVDPGQRLVQHATASGTRVGRLGGLQPRRLLRGHVVECPDHVAGRRRRECRVDHPRDAEIGQLRRLPPRRRPLRRSPWRARPRSTASHRGARRRARGRGPARHTAPSRSEGCHGLTPTHRPAAGPRLAPMTTRSETR